MPTVLSSASFDEVLTIVPPLVTSAGRAGPEYAAVCDLRSSLTGGLGLGSLSFAKPRNGVPPSPDVQNGIAAGQGLVRLHERKRAQRIAVTLRVMYASPMTHHVECVALLTRSGPDLR